MQQELEAEGKAAVREVEARTEVMKTELENLQQLYDAQLDDNKLMKEKLVSYLPHPWWLHINILQESESIPFI